MANKMGNETSSWRKEGEGAVTATSKDVMKTFCVRHHETLRDSIVTSIWVHLSRDHDRIGLGRCIRALVLSALTLFTSTRLQYD